MSNLIVDGPNVRRHPIFDGYVSDQKRIVSYNLGMAFAKFYAERIFDVPNLLHVEFLKKRDAITFLQTGGATRHKEPDLVGQSVGGAWHVFEAKGISGPESQLISKIRDAKIQLNQVLAIHGNQPETRTACATSIGNDRVFSRLEDPPGDVEKRIEISPDKFQESYYAPFLLAEEMDDMRRRHQIVDGISVEAILVRKGSRRLTIGLDSEIFDRLMQGKFEYSDSIQSRLSDYSQQQNKDYSIGLDGFFVQYSS